MKPDSNSETTSLETSTLEKEVFGEAPDFQIGFRLPKILFKSISTEPNSPWLRQIAIASVRRFFYLTEDWRLELISDRYPALSGTIVIQESVAGEKFLFDGASIPVPWLVSLLTLGVLRPLGVLLIASIVHDFAFRHGYLTVEKDSGGTERVPVARHQADDLFRDLVSVVNGNRVVGQVAWFFVRLGYWLGVKYNGVKRTGEPPYLVGVASLLIAGAITGLVLLNPLAVALGSLALYLSIYIFTLRELQAISSAMTLALLLGLIIAVACLAQLAYLMAG